MDPRTTEAADAPLDVLIVGAGISGVCAAHALMETCPDARFAIVEARDRLGGTWDLFRYPGIRSDSDMYTLGFSFRPWREPKAIADGPAILAYLEETARETGIAGYVRFGRRVEHAAWSSEDARWTVRLRTEAGIEQLTCRFLWVCAGYYRYDHGYTPEFPGIAQFGGRVVHPQQWPDALEVAGKKVVIVGSGATAVTIAPVLAAQGADVTLLQRTPTYVVSRPSRDRVAKWIEAVLPARAAYRVVRSKNITLNAAFYRFCQRFPGPAKRLLLAGVRSELGGDDADVSAFDPPYGPWDQRLCLVPDGDLFEAIRAERLRLVTDRIDRFTETGIALTSGDTLDADIVITATGLELQFFGGASVEVDGAPVDLRSARMYMGSMLSDVPNAAFVMGYTNASWTLKCELVCGYVARVLRHMRDHGYTRATPRRTDPKVGDRPAIEMSSGYFQRAIGRLPSQGTEDPWRLHQDFFRDRRLYRRRAIDDGVLELR